MAAQALEILSSLDAHCLRGMDPAIKRALILECAGKSHDEIAHLESVSKGAVESTLIRRALVRGRMFRIAGVHPQQRRPFRGDLPVRWVVFE